MRRFFEIFKMDMENILKNPVLVNANTVFPILLILIMGFLTSGTYANATSAYNYYTVTFLIYGMLNGAMTASNSFMERDIKKPNLRIIFSPVGSFPIYFSKILSSALFDMVCHLIVLAVLIPLLHLGINTNIGYFILLMIPIEFAAAALGTLFCCIFKTEEATSTLLSNTISILCFLGGTFFSFDGLGGPMAFVSHLSPVKWITDAFFALLFDGNRAVFLPIFLGGIAVSALLVLGCKICFKTEDYI
jgi:ABC-2 type transport system permease protein